MQARWYDLDTSAFLSPDPEMGEPSDPKLRLPYAYCASDPVGNWDPSGKSFRDLMSAMKNPALARVMVKNQALVPLLLLKKRGRGVFLQESKLQRNMNKAEGRSSSSGNVPLEDLPPEVQKAILNAGTVWYYKTDLSNLPAPIGGEQIFIFKSPHGAWKDVTGEIENVRQLCEIPLSKRMRDYVKAVAEQFPKLFPRGFLRELLKSVGEDVAKVVEIMSGFLGLGLSLEVFGANRYQSHTYDLVAVYQDMRTGTERTIKIAENLVDISYTHYQRSQLEISTSFLWVFHSQAHISLGGWTKYAVNYVNNAYPRATYHPRTPAENADYFTDEPGAEDVPVEWQGAGNEPQEPWRYRP